MSISGDERERLLSQLREANERLVSANLRTKGLLREIHGQLRLFQNVIDHAPVGIALVKGPRFLFELVNPAYQAFAPSKRMLGRPFAKVWPEEAHQVLPILKHALETGEPFHGADMPRTIRRSPGGPLEEACFSMAAVPFRMLGEWEEGLLLVVVETTEQVLARSRIEELAEEAQRRAVELQSVLDNMADGVFVADREGRVTLANEAGARMLGLADVEEAKGSLSGFPGLLQARHPDGSPLTLQDLPLSRALSGETVMSEDEFVQNLLTGMEACLRTNAAPVRDDQGNIVGAVAVTRDITDLAELDRLKDAFISVAAHELKTPVAVMKGYAQALLRTAEELDPQQRQMLEAINRGSDRIDRIVRELLDISRLQQGQLELALESIDLPSMVRQVCDRMALTVSRHRLRFVSRQRAVILGDRDRLEQVLVNLIDNAVRYSPTGGSIDLAVAVQDGEAVVSVTDFGVAIPEEKQGRIFQRFYRAHAGTPYDYGGMGVGLYISREIVSRHGGRMWFESEKGRGSSFYFSLPLRGERSGACAEEDPGS